jgi:hypothetical protein
MSPEARFQSEGVLGNSSIPHRYVDVHIFCPGSIRARSLIRLINTHQKFGLTSKLGPLLLDCTSTSGFHIFTELTAADELHLAFGELGEPLADHPDAFSDAESDPLGWGFSLD